MDVELASGWSRQGPIKLYTCATCAFTSYLESATNCSRRFTASSLVRFSDRIIWSKFVAIAKKACEAEAFTATMCAGFFVPLIVLMMYLPGGFVRTTSFGLMMFVAYKTQPPPFRHHGTNSDPNCW